MAAGGWRELPMGWFIAAAIVIAIVGLLAWRVSHRNRRSALDSFAFGPEDLRTRVWGNLGSGKDVKYRGR
jgi:hypothetical protein